MSAPKRWSAALALLFIAIAAPAAPSAESSLANQEATLTVRLREHEAILGKLPADPANIGQAASAVQDTYPPLEAAIDWLASQEKPNAGLLALVVRVASLISERIPAPYAGALLLPLEKKSFRALDAELTRLGATRSARLRQEMKLATRPNGSH